MIDWSYGVLETGGDQRAGEKGHKWNPIYVEGFNLTVGTPSRFKILGKGKVIQISFMANGLSVGVGVEIDGKLYSNINNGFCISKLSDSRGIGYTNIERCDRIGDMVEYRYTFLLPIIFKEKVIIRLHHGGHEDFDISVKNLHIYYLVPVEI